MAALRSLGDLGVKNNSPAFGVLARVRWKDCLSLADQFATWCLMIAMASVGLGTSLKKLRTLGIKPLCAGFAAAALVGVASFSMIKLLTR